MLLQAAGWWRGARALKEGKVSGARGGRRCCGAAGRRLSDDCWARAARWRETGGSERPKRRSQPSSRRAGKPRPFPTLAPHPAAIRRVKAAASSPQRQHPHPFAEKKLLYPALEIHNLSYNAQAIHPLPNTIPHINTPFSAPNNILSNVHTKEIQPKYSFRYILAEFSKE